MIDYDGTWFRLSSENASEGTINVANAGKTGAKLYLSNDKNDNSLWKMIQISNDTVRFTPKHAPE